MTRRVDDSLGAVGVVLSSVLGDGIEAIRLIGSLVTSHFEARHSDVDLLFTPSALGTG